MGLKNYRQIAQETLEIIDSNGYDMEDKHIALFERPYELRAVNVYTPGRALMAVQSLNNSMRNAVGEILVDRLDSLASAKTNGKGNVLVLNFANSFHPGGGFLRGAVAQEEAICRCSSLYASISSEQAKVMYEYNKANISPEGSDYMLLSPNVVVFRDRECNLLETPYSVSVITAAAPNLYDEACELKEPRLGEVMRHKIRNIMAVAALNSYDTLILGAWGCGAFGHDAYNMSCYLYDVLIGENYRRFFDRIVFSVFARNDSDYNYNEFAKRFSA